MSRLSATALALALVALAPAGAGGSPPAPKAGCRLIWGIVRSPTVPGAELRAVAAAAPNDVWAVGGPSPFSLRIPKPNALVEHFDGKRWTVVPSPPIAGALDGVAVAGPHDVWVVGEQGSLEHWYGGHWNQTRVAGVRKLWALAATSSRDVWAAGTNAVLHWNGSRWKVTRWPHAELIGLIAISPTDVWAVGSDNATRFLELHWDGTRWSAHSQLPPDGGYGRDYAPQLSAVAFTASRDVWAAGNAHNSGDPAYGDTVLMHWDGTRWRTVSMKSSWIWVDALAARSSGDVVLSGTWSAGDSYGGGVVQRWRSGRWQSKPFDGQRIEALTADPTGALWCAGFTGSYPNGLGYPTATTPRIERGHCS